METKLLSFIPAEPPADPRGGGYLYNPLFEIPNETEPVTFFQKFLPALIGLAFVVGVLIFFFMFIMGAIGWISSGSDKGAMEEAKSKITNALIGLVILFSFYAVALLINSFFGISILTLDIGSLVIQ